MDPHGNREILIWHSMQIQEIRFKRLRKIFPATLINNTPCNKKHIGCRNLLIAVQDRIKPKYRTYGHIHDDSGVGLMTIQHTKMWLTWINNTLLTCQ